MSNTHQEEKRFASMSEVVMKKDELLTHLIKNKAKHDVVLATAIAGYWDLAKAKIEEKQKKLLENVTEWKEECDREFTKYYAKIEAKEQLPSHVSLKMFGVDTNLGLVYPQDHSQDYDRAIRMMQASIYDEVELTVNEFDAYVLNNWEWKNNFLFSNSVYVAAARSKGGFVKGNNPSVVITGSYTNLYNAAADSAIESFMCSGYTPTF
jgi:hypothetical protein